MDGVKPFGLQLYTLRDLLATSEGVLRTLPKVREIGYEYVQASGVSGMSGRELRQALDDNGLKCAATHCGYDAAISNRAPIFEEMASLGAKHTAVSSLPGELHTGAGYRDAGEALEEAAADFARHGFTLSYHTHGFDFERFAGRTAYDHMFTTARRKGQTLGCEFDVFWLANAGCDPADYVLEHPGPVFCVHLKDCAVVKGRAMTAEVGSGNLNWHAILAAMKRKGVEWYFVEQDDCVRPPLESVAMSFRWLKLHSTELGPS